jgi:hypothetical protein
LDFNDISKCIIKYLATKRAEAKLFKKGMTTCLTLMCGSRICKQ